MKRRDCLGATVLALWLGPEQLARGASVLAVRVWPARDYTRLTIESDIALKARQFLVGDPPRLAVDIEGLDLNPTLRDIVKKVQTDDPNVAGVRIGQNQPNVVRLVFDLKQAVSPQVFSLLPTDPYQHRLVLDLYPTRRTDPLEELIQQRLDRLETAVAQGPTPVTKPGGDALEALIAQHSQNSAKKPGNTAEKPVVPGTGVVSTGPDNAKRLIVVVLDPGHGGEDPGAIGPKGTQEKDVVLQVALKLREQLQQTPLNGNTVRVVLTRDGDFFVPLQTRVEKARRVQADLFVSLHADAFYNPDPQGASVYALSERGASSATARWMAEQENRSDQVGGINNNSRDAHVQRALFDMSTTAQINDSLKLGGALLGEIGRVGKLHKPKVEQAAFAVLKAPDIPSILVETAFISNPQEEARLLDRQFQERLAEALKRGILRYFAANPPLARNRSV